MRIRSAIAAAAAAIPLVLGGCLDVLPADSGRAGFMTISTFDDEASGFLISPVAAFYTSSGLSFTVPQTETCQIIPFTTLASLPSGTGTVDAGERVLVTLPLRVDTLLPVTSFNFRVYQRAVGAGIPHTPGDVVQITVPGGAGFPAVNTQIVTAEAFTHQAVGTAPQGENISLVWTPATNQGSVMVVSLRYANELSGGEVNEQIQCAFLDDGAAEVPQFLLNGWNSTIGSRATVFTRLQVVNVNLSGNASMTVISTFNRPLPPLPQAQ